MAQAKNRGRFVWQELMTDDPAAATAFYTRLLGWRSKASSGDDGYTELHAGAVGVGGMMKIPDSAKAQGARPMWMPYISSDSVDDAVREIEGLGGKTMRPTTEIPHVGRFAVISDPQGAVFAVYTPSSQPTAPQPSGQFTPGQFSWHELATTDHEAAFTFYSKVFGWEELLRHDMGPMGTYLVFGADGVQYGGMFKMGPHHGPHPYWLPYAAVADVDASVKVIGASSGRIVNGPMDVPGGGRIAQLLDPGGAPFAIHAQAKAAAHAAADKPAAAPSNAAPPSAPKKPAKPPAAARASTPAATPSAAPAVKPKAVTRPKPEPTPAAAATTVAAAPAAAKQVPVKKVPARKKTLSNKPVVAKKKAAPKKKAKAPASKKVVAKPKVAAAPKGKVKKHKKDKDKKKHKKKKDKKKSKKERKKEKKARRKK